MTDRTGSAVCGTIVTAYPVMCNGCNYLAQNGFEKWTREFHPRIPLDRIAAIMFFFSSNSNRVTFERVRQSGTCGDLLMVDPTNKLENYRQPIFAANAERNRFPNFLLTCSLDSLYVYRIKVYQLLPLQYSTVLIRSTPRRRVRYTRNTPTSDGEEVERL